MTPTYKLGKLPARKDAILFKLKNYQTTIPVPSVYSHAALIGSWGMLGNDQYGDCVWAGAGHETMVWNKEQGVSVTFTPASVLHDYSACTGFDPKKPDTDQGTDMQAAASYRLKTGLTDVTGKKHKIAAYLEVTPGNVDEIKMALYQFGVVGLGIEFPDSAMTQFNANKNWSVVAGAQIDGGHYVPVVGYDKTYAYVVSWGKVVKATWSFVRKYMDEGAVYLSEEMMHLDKSLEGFSFAQLQSDLTTLYH